MKLLDSILIVALMAFNMIALIEAGKPKDFVCTVGLPSSAAKIMWACSVGFCALAEVVVVCCYDFQHLFFCGICCGNVLQQCKHRKLLRESCPRPK